MKLREIFRFELAYQLRRVSTWLYFATLAVVVLPFVRGNYIDNARSGGYLLNSPFVIAVSTVFGCMIWLLAAAAVAGEAAARDAETRMDPLTYTAPISKADYLGGRFLAAFVHWVQIKVFAPVEKGKASGQPLSLRMHRIRSGRQTITVTVPRKPARAGIDPNYLLIDWEWDDNVEEIRAMERRSLWN